MALRAKRPCGTPGCKGLRRPGEQCPRCGKRSGRSGWQSDKQRGDRHARGYGNDWYKARAAKLREDPLCKRCLRMQRTELAVEIHHIRPFKGVNDPLRLDMANLESMCKTCHQAATAGTGPR